MKILSEPLTIDQLRTLAENFFGDQVKAVVDIEREIIALDAELHADLEAHLLEEGSSQKDLWGINLFPELTGDDFIEYNSMINVRPAQKNRSRMVEDAGTRIRIDAIVARWIVR